MKINTTILFFAISFLAVSCGKINLLTLEQEKQLGYQSVQQIESDPKIQVLDPNQYASAYSYINGVRDAIKNSGKLKYANDFEWRVRIIKDDKTLNAFCTPGGYIYFYTGLIKYLDNGSALAGVMGHEMAHADLRHSGKQLTSQMGIDFLLQIIAGATSTQIAQLASMFTQLGSLKYSRSHETESDESSVNFLCSTQYLTDGASYFFEKLIADNKTPSVPEYLSTHPNPDNRVSNIVTKAAQTSSCSATKLTKTNDAAFNKFKTDLGL